jgi:biopolymer transport protein ExbD
MKTKPSENEAIAAPVAAPHINVTPLIDVLLVLPIIFMVITPLKPSRFKALVPQQADPGVKPNPLALVVTIERNLHLKLNGGNQDLGTVDEPSKLSAALMDTFAQRKAHGTLKVHLSPAAMTSGAELIEKTVMIKAPRSISYGDVAKVIDGIKGAGAAPIGLQIYDLSP